MSESPKKHAQKPNRETALDLDTAIRRYVLTNDARYTLGAYLFVYEALAYTQKRLGRDGKDLTPEDRHVSGQELLAGIHDCAMEQFGPLAPTVFRSWGIRASRDFGDIVFNLVNHGLLGKTDQDTPDDFEGGFDLDTAFEGPYEVKPS